MFQKLLQIFKRRKTSDQFLARGKLLCPFQTLSKAGEGVLSIPLSPAPHGPPLPQDLLKHPERKVASWWPAGDPGARRPRGAEPAEPSCARRRCKRCEVRGVGVSHRWRWGRGERRIASHVQGRPGRGCGDTLP